ncbi:hypothetical protein GGS21DRAFT_509678 [Xylaria nigripes]|nr:hypothetical protein GGS21DRAFT_509678 [Xylaria nigripes]
MEFLFSFLSFPLFPLSLSILSILYSLRPIVPFRFVSFPYAFYLCFIPSLRASSCHVTSVPYRRLDRYLNLLFPFSTSFSTRLLLYRVMSFKLSQWHS